MATDFKFLPLAPEPLSGPSFISQTEVALSELRDDVDAVGADVSDIRDTANQALTTANEASVTAGEALTAAGNAQTTADNALTAAQTAQDAAESADAKADDAISQAGNALATADLARSEAQQAQTTAESAVSAVDDLRNDVVANSEAISEVLVYKDAGAQIDADTYTSLSENVYVSDGTSTNLPIDTEGYLSVRVDNAGLYVYQKFESVSGTYPRYYRVGSKATTGEDAFAVVVTDTDTATTYTADFAVAYEAGDQMTVTVTGDATYTEASTTEDTALGTLTLAADIQNGTIVVGSTTVATIADGVVTGNPAIATTTSGVVTVDTFVSDGASTSFEVDYTHLASATFGAWSMIGGGGSGGGVSPDDLGTAAWLNAGTGSGDIPVLGEGGVLSDAVLPLARDTVAGIARKATQSEVDNPPDQPSAGEPDLFVAPAELRAAKGQGYQVVGVYTGDQSVTLDWDTPKVIHASGFNTLAVTFDGLSSGYQGSAATFGLRVEFQSATSVVSFAPVGTPPAGWIVTNDTDVIIIDNANGTFTITGGVAGRELHVTLRIVEQQCIASVDYDSANTGGSGEVSNASEAVAGILRFANGSEVVAGTANNLGISPYRLAELLGNKGLWSNPLVVADANDAPLNAIFVSAGSPANYPQDAYGNFVGFCFRGRSWTQQVVWSPNNVTAQWQRWYSGTSWTAWSRCGNPPGTILTMATSTVPAGTLLCNGALVSRTQYPELFAAIGTTYGAGNGTTTFQLPELRGEFLRGLDGGRGVDSGRTIGSAQGDAIRNITGQWQPTTRWANDSLDYFAGALTPTNVVPSTYQFSRGSLTNCYGVAIDASRVVPTAAENRPRNVAINYVIVF